MRRLFPSTKGENVRAGRKGAGYERVNGSVIAVVPGSIARLSVNLTEGVLGERCRRSKPTSVLAGPGSAEAARVNLSKGGLFMQPASAGDGASA